MKFFKKILKWTGLLLLLLVACGAAYEQIGLALDSKLVSPSELVRVGNRTARIVCMGDGPRTYVLDAGASGWSVFWWRVQPLLAKTGRACAFDRAGLGWSDPSNVGYDGAAAADELAALVRAANIPRPFIYVGHSLGANLAQIYYAKYPQDVAAMVLMEPGDPPDLLEDFHGTRTQAFAARDCNFTCYAAEAAGYAGLTRLMAVTIVRGHSFEGRNKQDYRAGIARPYWAMALVALLNALPKTAYEDQDVATFGDTPVLGITSSNTREPEGKETVEDVKKWKARYLDHFRALLAKSTHNSGVVEIPDSTHVTMVLGERQSAASAQAILDFVQANLSAGAAP